MTKKKILCIILMGLVCNLCLGGCGKTSEIDKLIGTWELDDMGADTRYQGYIIEFYEPDEKGGTSGSLGYLNSHGSQRRGVYSYHESSKTLELSLYDEFGVPNSDTDYFTFNIEVNDNDSVELQSEDLTFELTRVVE